jgi:hypothetical membrane protein
LKNGGRSFLEWREAVMINFYSIFGIVAPLSYVLAVIVGGFFIEGYSHMYNSISELTAANVPRVPITYTLFALYNFSLIVFGITYKTYIIACL